MSSRSVIQQVMSAELEKGTENFRNKNWNAGLRPGAFALADERAGPEAGVPSGRKTDGQFHGGIFRMNFPITRADDQIGFVPSLIAKPFRQIVHAHQAKQRDERRI